MSDTNNTPEVSTTVTTEVFDINGLRTEVLVETRKKRGSDAVSTSYIPKLEAGSIIDWLIKQWGSAEKVAAVLIRDIIKPMGHEASSSAYDEASDSFSELKYAEAIVQYGEPASRRKGGLTTKDIQVRLSEIAPEFTTLVLEFSTNGGAFDSEEKTNRFQQLMLEQQQLTKALAEKEKGAGARKAKKAAKAKAAKEVAEVK